VEEVRNETFFFFFRGFSFGKKFLLISMKRDRERGLGIFRNSCRELQFFACFFSNPRIT